MIVDDGNSSVAQHPSAIEQGLKDYWGPVCFEKPSDSETANKFLDLYAAWNRHLSEFSSLELPSGVFFGR